MFVAWNLDVGDYLVIGDWSLVIFFTLKMDQYGKEKRWKLKN